MYKSFFNSVVIVDLGSGKIKAGTSNSEEPIVFDSLIGRPKYQKVKFCCLIVYRVVWVPVL